MGRDRQYKVPKEDTRTKAYRLKREQQVRDKNYKALPAFAREIHEIFYEHGRDVLEATGKGFALDEVQYTRRVLNLLRDKYTREHSVAVRRVVHPMRDNQFVGRQ